MYKFINQNQTERYKGGFIVYDNKIYTNPTEETLRLAGYKELEEAEMPEYDPETQYVETTYEDGENITVVYTVKDINVPDNVAEAE